MNVRLSVLLVVILGLIGGSVYITQELSTKEREPRPDWLYRIDIEDITSISVTTSGGNMSYVHDGDQWIIKDGNDTPVFIDKWAGTTLLLSGPRSDRLLAEEIDDPAKYGLEPPQTEVTVVDQNGLPLTFHLGSTTSDGSQRYTRLVGSGRLFTVAAIWGDVVSKLATEPPYAPTPVPTPVPPEEEDAPAAG